MNRIFFALIAVAFALGAWRQVTLPTPEDPPPTPHVTIPESDDPTVRALAAEVERLRGEPVDPPRPPAPMEALQNAVLDNAKTGVDLVIGLIGVMAFFLGLMRVAEDAGALRSMSRLIRPLLVRAFPDVPPDHPAMSAMVLNLSANALGLANAATPFGIKAMQELDRLNRFKGTATNAMVLFLAINTSGVTLLPTGTIAIRKGLGSLTPAAILPTTLFATIVSTVTAVLVVRLLVPRVATAEALTPPEDVREVPEPDREAVETPLPEWASWLAIGGLFVLVPAAVVWGDRIGPWIVPGLVVGILTYGWLRGVRVYESFVAGAREGWDGAVRIVPNLVAILAAVGMFRASGALGALVSVVAPLTAPLGLPAEAVPMALVRPLSGSGAMGLMISILKDPATGPDTYTGFLVSTIMGCTETTFYVLAVYFGSVGVTRFRHAIAAGLAADAAGIVGSVVACRVWFALNT